MGKHHKNINRGFWNKVEQFVYLGVGLKIEQKLWPHETFWNMTSWDMTSWNKISHPETWHDIMRHGMTSLWHRETRHFMAWHHKTRPDQGMISYIQKRHHQSSRNKTYDLHMGYVSQKPRHDISMTSVWYHQNHRQLPNYVSHLCIKVARKHL